MEDHVTRKEKKVQAESKVCFKGKIQIKENSKVMGQWLHRNDQLKKQLLCLVSSPVFTQLRSTNKETFSRRYFPRDKSYIY